MHDRTKKTFEELEKAQWFQKVGQKDTQVAIVLSSWEEAIKSCASSAWQNLLLEAANQYTEKLASISRERNSSRNESCYDPLG
jgi:hypothetical protein